MGRVANFSAPGVARPQARPGLSLTSRGATHTIEVERMNKAELIDAVAEQADLSKAAASNAVDAVFDVITGRLKASDSVTLVGFGTFSVKQRAARAGRNPQRGATIQIAASNLPAFKPGKALKDAVN